MSITNQEMAFQLTLKYIERLPIANPPPTPEDYAEDAKNIYDLILSSLEPKEPKRTAIVLNRDKLGI
jgi:hypothetical protein